jgi:hypothetical protein
MTELDLPPQAETSGNVVDSFTVDVTDSTGTDAGTLAPVGRGNSPIVQVIDEHARIAVDTAAVISQRGHYPLLLCRRLS